MSNQFVSMDRIALLIGLSLFATFPKPSHAQKAPDITSKKGITIGGAVGGAGGKFSPWGGSIQLTEANAVLVAPSNGQCAFNLSYDLVNQGPVATSKPFENYLRTNQAIVSKQSQLTLKANETKAVNTQAYLPAGKYPLHLVLDTTAQVAESNEMNNAVTVTVTVGGKCK
jgi:hypothetical protein